MGQQILHWIQRNQLVRVTVVKRKSGRQTVIGRILHYEPDTERILIYDVDHKITHNLNLSEIDEIAAD